MNTDDFDSEATQGTSAVYGGLRGTSLSASRTIAASSAMQSVMVFLSDELTVGATFEMVESPIEATEGKGYVQVLQSTFAPIETNQWRASSGTVRIDAFDGESIQVSATDLPMIPAVTNAPSNTATGTFDATLDATVLMISGL